MPLNATYSVVLGHGHSYVLVCHPYVTHLWFYHEPFFHGKTTDELYTSTYEWHTDDIRVYTSDIRMTYEYIRMTYRCVCHLYVLVCHPYVTRLWVYHKPFFKRYIERIKLYSCMKFELWTRIVNSRERKNVFWMRFSQTISVGLLDCHCFRLRINVK